MLKVTGYSFSTTYLSKEEGFTVTSKGLMGFLSLPQPPFYCGKNTAGTHLWLDRLARDLVFQMPLTQRCEHSSALPVCLSCLINSSFLAKETLIRGHYILS